MITAPIRILVEALVFIYVLNSMLFLSVGIFITSEEKNGTIIVIIVTSIAQFIMIGLLIAIIAMINKYLRSIILISR